MRLPNDKFSVAVTGSGKLHSMFFAEFQSVFPNATMYDRSGVANKARAAEAALGKTEFASPDFRKSTIAIEKNLANPPKTDINVHFEPRGNIEAVSISSSSGKRMFNFDDDKVGSIDGLVDYVKQLINAIKLM